MKLLITSTLFLLASIGTVAQTLDKKVVSSAGKFEAVSSLSLEYTVGEWMVGTVSHAEISLYQGFNQGYKKNKVGLPLIETKDAVRLYPNPTALWLSISAPFNGTFSVQDNKGRQILVGDLYKDVTNTMDVSELSSGVYVLKYMDSNGTVSNIKWVKL